MQKIWQRYLFSHLTKTFLFILVSLFLVYAIIDLSIHGVRFFSNATTSWSEILYYYMHNFAKHLELFFPLTFLLASLKVLLDLNTHHELVALQMAGLSKKNLLLPFFFLATLLAFLSYGNSQWLAPSAQDEASAFRTKHGKGKTKVLKKPVYHISLKDSSELIYQNFNTQTQELFDVFWVQINKEIWHMKYLNIAESPPIGRFVDHLERNHLQTFEKTESFLSRSFPSLIFTEDMRFEKFIPFENRSLSTLLLQSIQSASDKKSILSHLHYKIATPLLSFLVLFAIAPSSMRFSRTKAPFLLFSISIFAFVGFMTILEGMLIFGENQVLPGAMAIWGPIACLLFFTLPRFVKEL